MPTPVPTPPLTGGSLGAGITIAIVDTGVDSTHREFAGRYSAASTCFSGATCPTALARAGGDDEGHGTHVAGIAAGATRGRAPQATILSVKALDAEGEGYSSDIANAVSYAASRGARVINLSLGGGGMYYPMQQALTYAASRAVIVAAAGNEGNFRSPEYPGAYALTTGIRGSLIIVGAVNSQNQIASFSNTPAGRCQVVGATSYCMRNYFVVAPGVSILSSIPGGRYAYYSGTSMATPYVSGVVAQVLSRSPFLTPQQAVDIIFRTTIDLGLPGIDETYGRGLVSPSRALAPVGYTSLAVSGETTADYVGTGEALAATFSGPAGGALSKSSLLKSAILLDAYGRDYAADLTASAGNRPLSVWGLVADHYAIIHPFQMARGGFAVSGFAVAADPLGKGMRMREEDTDPTRIQDLTVSMRFSDVFEAAAAFNADMGGRVSAFDLGADVEARSLFVDASAVDGPYLSLADGGDFAGVSYAPFDDLTVRFAYMRADREALLPGIDDASFAIDAARNLRSAERQSETVALALNWEAEPWLGLSFNAAQITEEGGFLGGVEAGAWALTDSATTYSAGLSARAELGAGWRLTGSYSMGVTSIVPLAGSIATGFSDLTTAAYGLALTKDDVFMTGDLLGLSISRPIHVIEGSAALTLATGVDAERRLIYGSEVLNLAGVAETNFELGYTTPLFDGDGRFSLSAAYQIDAGGIAGEEGLAGLVRFALTF